MGWPQWLMRPKGSVVYVFCYGLWRHERCVLSVVAQLSHDVDQEQRLLLAMIKALAMPAQGGLVRAHVSLPETVQAVIQIGDVPGLRHPAIYATASLAQLQADPSLKRAAWQQMQQALQRATP